MCSRCERHHGLSSFAQVDSQGLATRHVVEPSFLQPGEALETVGVYRGTWGHVLLQEGHERCALEVRDDRHAGAPGSIAPLLHGNKDQGRFPAFELSASEQACLRTANPRIINLQVALQWFARQVDHGPAEFVKHHPRGLVASQGKLALKEERRDPALIGGHQVGSPEPNCQRRFCIMQNRPGSQ